MKPVRVVLCSFICCRCLGEKTSSIELDTSEMTQDQMVDLEVAVNEKIRAGCKMFPTLYDSKEDVQLLDVCITHFMSLLFHCH